MRDWILGFECFWLVMAGLVILDSEEVELVEAVCGICFYFCCPRGMMVGCCDLFGLMAVLLIWSDLLDFQSKCLAVFSGTVNT